MGCNAYCPFYLSEKKGRVFCEAALIHLPDKQARDEIVLQYCAREQNHKTCPFYVALDNYYARKYNTKKEAKK